METQAKTVEPATVASLTAPLKAMFRLGTPLIAFFLVQNAVNLASLAMLGRLGNAALAGVGAASAVYGVVLALLFGFDTGVQAIVSRITGAGRENRLGEVLAYIAARQQEQTEGRSKKAPRRQGPAGPNRRRVHAPQRQGPHASDRCAAD